MKIPYNNLNKNRYLNMKKLFYISGILCLVLFVFACKKDSTPAPAPPVISYANFTTSDAYNGILTFNFSDADGDIGLNQSDTTGAYAPGQVGYYDFYMRYYCLSPATGKYLPFYYAWPGLPLNSLTDSTIFAYRIPFVTDNIKSKSLSGQIIVNLSQYKPANIKPGTSGDSLNSYRYEFWMYDRAMHKSNVVTTPTFYTYYP